MDSTIQAQLRPQRRWSTIHSNAELPEKPACYVLCGNGCAYYVGQTGNLRSRISGHGWEITAEGVLTPKGFIRGAYLKACRCRAYGEWLMVEARLIRRLEPLWNKIANRTRLHPLVARAVTEKYGFESRDLEVRQLINAFRRASGRPLLPIA